MEGHVIQSSISTQTETPKTQLLDQEVAYVNSNINNNNNHAKVDDSSILTSTQMVKKKRGRPRKYDINGSVLSPTSSMHSTHAIGTPPKRGRGRPRGSANKHTISSPLKTTDGSFKPHVMTVNTGEDVVSKILAFSQNDVPLAAVSILSATGVVSSVLIRNSHSSIHTLRRKGCFEVLSLSGSYTFVADGGAHCKKGMLSILLAEPDGSVFGGILEGSLIAAGPIQLVVASFKQNIRKEIIRRHSAGSSAARTLSTTTITNPDLERVPLKVPSIIEGSRIPAENAILATTTIGVSDNVIPTNQNMQSALVNGVGLGSQAMQPITDHQSIAAHDNASV